MQRPIGYNREVFEKCGVKIYIFSSINIYLKYFIIETLKRIQGKQSICKYIHTHICTYVHILYVF